MPQRPWMHDELMDWSIVGMNHYHDHRGRRIFVAMTRDGRVIKAEGPDTMAIWEALRAQARKLDRERE